MIEDKEFAEQVINELVKNAENRSEVKVKSELRVPFVDWTKQKIADVLEFVI